MRFGELIFVFIAISIGLISVIARAIASKRKGKDEGAAPQERPSQKKAVETLPLTEFRGMKTRYALFTEGRACMRKKLKIWQALKGLRFLRRWPFQIMRI